MPNNSPPILRKLPSLDDNELLRLYKNCLVQIEKESSLSADAKVILESIFIIWDERLAAYRRGTYKAKTPEEGLLKALDYKVGNSGEPASSRRKILRQIMTQRLPLVGSPAYMDEWGTPSSYERYRKLRRVLKILSSSSEHNPSMEKASREWSGDRDWLINQWEKGEFDA